MSQPVSSWDAICVGAGITSLAFAAQVAMRERNARILLIDKHSVPGGYASVFTRPKAGAVFDCSLHKLSGTGDGGNLRRIFADLGLDHDLKLEVSGTYFDSVLPDGRHVVLPNDAAACERALCECFPADAAAIGEFFREVNVYGRHGYYQFQMLEGSYQADMAELRHAHRHLKNITVADALGARISDPWLREVLGATGIYVGGYPEDLGYLYFLHVVYATLCKGNAYVLGASEQLSQALVQRIESAGGQVLLGTSVTRVLIDESGNAEGVQTTQGRFDAKRIYINASPHYALRDLFEPAPQLQPVRDRLVGLRPSRSTTTVYLTTDSDPAELGLPCCETMVFARDGDGGEALAARRAAAAAPHDGALGEFAYWQLSPMEVTNYHLLNPAAGRVVCLNVLDAMSHWPARRDTDYKAKKQRATDTLLGRLLEACPRLAGHVVYTELATPRTYERFTNNTDGAGYGAMVGTDISSHTFHWGFPFGGVQFLSAWVAGPSYEAAFGYAEMKAKRWAA